MTESVEGNTGPIKKTKRALFGLGHAADAARYAFEGLADQMRFADRTERPTSGAITNTPPTPLRRGDTVSWTTEITMGDKPEVGELRTNKAGHFQAWDGTRWVLHDPHQGQPVMRAGGCKECGDPADHHGDPHPGRVHNAGASGVSYDTRYNGGAVGHNLKWDGTAGTMGRGVRGPSPSMVEVDEIADFEASMLKPRKPMAPLMDPTLSAVLKRRPSKLEVHSDDAEWLEDQLLNHRIPSAAVTPALMDGDAGPDSAVVEVTELVEPGTVRAHYWTPVRNVFTLEHETEWVDVVIR